MRKEEIIMWLFIALVVLVLAISGGLVLVKYVF